MLGLLSSCTGPFLQTYPKMALLSPLPFDRGTNFLIWKQNVTGRRGFPKRWSLVYWWKCLNNVLLILSLLTLAGLRSAVGNVSGYRCVSDCRSRGREFDPGPAPYFRGDWSWNDFYSHSPPFRWFIQEGLLSVTSESMCTNYWLTACSSLPRKKCC